MFKWSSFYYFLEFHCKILNSYAINRCKKMAKILNCYLYAKKSYGTLSKGAIFLAISVYDFTKQVQFEKDRLYFEF